MNVKKYFLGINVCFDRYISQKIIIVDIIFKNKYCTMLMYLIINIILDRN